MARLPHRKARLPGCEHLRRARRAAPCLIPTFVLSPYVVPGARDTRDHNLYSLLGTIEDILGLPRLGRAVGQPSLRPGLRF